MRRALELAGRGAGYVSPNPAVGAVIVAPDGRIIGEGWHRHYGGPHAEVNAVASVATEDEELLPLSTIYVTLEPCSHWGKTPPCSKLLIEKRLRRVVVGTVDPFREVSGRGIGMLREAGIEVSVGVLEVECRNLLRRFITAHTLRRPYIQLKWAQTADGFIAACNSNGTPKAIAISNPATLVAMHRERALADAILVGTDTVITDNPSLTTRLCPGRSPRPVLFRSPRLPEDAAVMQRDPILLDPDTSLAENMDILYSQHGITSLMVEGGRHTLTSFLSARIFDEIRIETSTATLASDTSDTSATSDTSDTSDCGIPAPTLPPSLTLVSSHTIRSHRIDLYHPSISYF